MTDLITVGSKTSTGGVVLSGNGGVKINGQPTALIGDTATCLCGSIICRGQGPIVKQSSRAANISGVDLARVGDLVDTGCGSCYLMASSHQVSLGTSTSAPLNIGSGVNIGNGVNINGGTILGRGVNVGTSQDVTEIVESVNSLMQDSVNIPVIIPDISVFKEYFPNVLKHEGGYVDDPNDLGGATNKGVTYITFKSVSKKLLQVEPTLSALKSLTDEQAYTIYKNKYWDKINGDEINDKYLAFQIFDFYINAGNNAIRVLQETILNQGGTVSADGFWGGKTLSAVNSSNANDLYIKYREAREEYYKRIVKARPKNARFLNGWLNRARSFNAY